MNIIHLNTLDINGGAARAAYRLHNGLRQLGQESILLVKEKNSSDPTVYSVEHCEKNFDELLACLKAIQNNYINSNRTNISNILFSLPYPGLDISQIQQVFNSNIIHLHWLALGFQSPITINKLLALGKPVVWTLHDMWPFTGGCHSSAKCHKYQEDCVQCPQLADDPYNLSAAILKDKIELLTKFTNLTIVAPSQHMAKFAKQSSIFRNHRVETIANSLETEVFKPLPKSQAKQKLGIDTNARIILFGAENGNQRSKGFTELLKAIQIAIQDSKFQKLVKQNKLKLACFGHAPDEIELLSLNTICFGYINSNEKLREIYSAADVFVQPSLEESFGNTTLEAMSCGTPVVAFDVGIAPELLKYGDTGKVIPLMDVQQMAAAIVEFVINPKQCEQMGKNCRHLVEESYSITAQARRYLNLYNDLLKDKRTNGQKLIHEIVPLSSTNNNPILNGTTIIAPLETTLGSNFQQIMAEVALKAILPEYINNKTKQPDFTELQAELQRCQLEIEAMKTSKFWKLRTQWFTLKKRLGLPVDD